MSGKLSFIHCADLHLDSPFKGLRNIPSHLYKDVIDSTFKALENLVNVAISKNVDFVLIVGDLFDQEQQSIKAMARLKMAFEQLHQHEIDVFVSYGNHDHLKGRLFDYDYPKNVHVFDSEQVSHFVFEKEGIPAATIYGFSYEQRAVHTNKAVEYEKADQTPLHIGMLHGSLNSNTDHDIYAPFQLSDLTEKDFDYWALGHIHKRQLLKEMPPIVYPGNIQGRSRKETGEKGCYYVELDEQGCSLEFFPLHTIRFENITLDVSHCDSLQDLEMHLGANIRNHKEVFGRCILDITLAGRNEQLEEWEQAGFLDEIIEFMNELYEQELDWAFIRHLQLKEQVRFDRNELKTGQHFLGELIRNLEETRDVNAYLEPLFYHRQARKYLNHFSDEDKQTIMNHAEHLLINELLKD